ncbi:MAG: hypothetical protein ACHRXM_06225 [Isosphaerales bacterium]
MVHLVVVLREKCQQLGSIPEIPEIHDCLLAIAAKHFGATIVTPDPIIQASTQVKWLW